MSLFGKLFGGQSSGKAAGGSGKISYLAVLQKQDQKFTVRNKRCDVCGRTFPFPSSYANIFTTSLTGWVMDAGGYCRTCRVYLCPSHAGFKQVQGSEKAYENGCHRPACSKCGSFLVYPQIDLIRVPPAKKNKFSLKAMIEERGVQITSRTCKECGASYPHPMNDYLLIPGDTKVSPGDISVDLGGYCQCCGYFVCAKHATIGIDAGNPNEIYWQVECGTCKGFPLIATEKPLETTVPGAPHPGCFHKTMKEAIASAMAQFSTLPTKRFSLRKVALSQGELLVERKCGLCGATFSSTERLFSAQMSLKVMAENKVTDEDFDVDLGGYCHSCKNYVCPKHATFIGADVEDKRLWALACGNCSQILTPNPNVKLPG